MRTARRVANSILISALVASCATTPRPADTTTAATGPQLFQFNWPEGASALVTERSTKKGRLATTRYRITLARADDDKRELRTTDFEFVAIEGVDLANEQLRAALQPTFDLASAIPSLVINDDAEVEDVRGWEDVVGRLKARGRGRDAKLDAMFERMFADPEVVTALKQKMGERWMTWVGVWVGTELEPGASVSGELELPVPGGRSVTSPVTVRHLGHVDGDPRRARLSYSGVMGGEALQSELVGLVNRLAPELPFEDFLKRIKSVSRTTVLEVTTDPGTLRPERVSSRLETRITLEGAEPKLMVEAAEYSFDWRSR